MVGDNKNISHILSTNAFLLSKFILMAFDSCKIVKSSFNLIGNRNPITRSLKDLSCTKDAILCKELVDAIMSSPVSNRNNLSDLGIFGNLLFEVSNKAYLYKTPPSEKHSYNKLTSNIRQGSHGGLSQISNKRGFNTISFINKAIVVKPNKFLLVKLSRMFDGR